jgi:hypothetical protein
MYPLDFQPACIYETWTETCKNSREQRHRVPIFETSRPRPVDRSAAAELVRTFFRESDARRQLEDCRVDFLEEKKFRKN